MNQVEIVSKVSALVAVLGQLSQNDAQFAQSLVANFKLRSSLSEKQLYWVDVLTQRASAPKVEVKPAEVLNVVAIQDLFDRASKNLKNPKVKLRTQDGQNVVFSRAGDRSKYVGQVLITDGAPFGSNVFFGRIDTAGNFYPTGRCSESVVALVREFADNPAAAAGRYGKLTGNCSFCKHSLTDNRSLNVGYGPICADKFQLPWG